MRYLIRWAAVAGLLLLLALPSLVQAQGSLFIDDPDGRLDEAAVRAAAQPLLARGAMLAIYIVDNDGVYDFDDRLVAAGLQSPDGAFRSNGLAIYYELGDRWSEFAFGTQWNPALAVNDNHEAIRQTVLDPKLDVGDFTAAVVNTLGAFEAAAANPPRPGGVTVNDFFWPALVGGGVAATGGGVYAYRRRRQTLEVRARLEEQLKDAREQASALITNLGMRFRAQEEKAKFDRVSYAAGDVDRLRVMQTQVSQAFIQVQDRFKTTAEELNRREQPTNEQLEQATAGYQGVQTQAEQVQEQMRAIEELRAKLDIEAQAAREAIERAKKDLTDAANQLEALGNAMANPAAALQSANEQMAHAEAAMERYEAIPATQAAQAASELAQAIGHVAERLGTIMQQFAAERSAGSAVVEQGYRLDASHAAIDAGAVALTAAATALKSRQGPAEATPHLEKAEELLQQAIASGSGAPALRAANAERLAEVEALGEATSARIDEGLAAFDQVDEFAESSWSDISGNDTEAQAAADRAQEHWELAAAANSMEQQQFLAARNHLESATAELEFVEQLVDAIITRLNDIEVARDGAPALLAEAERSLNDAIEFVRSNDDDVGQEPEQQIREATQYLNQAKTEAQQDKPDWLRLSVAASAADRLADAALAGARDEAVSMDRMRQQIAKLRPLATAEVAKIARYVTLHGQDIQAETTAAVKNLVQQHEQAQALERQAEERIEDQRRDALEQALALYARIQGEGEGVYQRAFADVQRLEQLRTELNKHLTDARRALDEGESMVRQARSHALASDVQVLQQSRASFDAIRMPITGQANLEQTVALAQRIAREAREASANVRRRIPRSSPSMSSPGPISSGGWGSSSSWSSSRGSSSSRSSGSSSWGSRGGGGGRVGRSGGGGRVGRGGGGGRRR
ncbi:chromosome partitioning protein ParA [Candidatus Viridilinea mediisalina]|uniref:Chromosome partitioning protein ParA n=1 Tax=Candidatus Viridilinea mediisalina TaxID=2024553 RepID=A0A2A6RN03_9CHLR|nr:chromosome partitioning protein ParA [Candidatus Viridilinea mediisalina]PDW04249.1 hypothetical protein CJ255_04680 [Candidatus Viridilinea mediisalina]